MLPLAHAGHYAVWVLYALPVLFVVAAIVRGQLMTRREGDSPAGGREGEVEHDPARRPPPP
jgi:hypothetical protein